MHNLKILNKKKHSEKAVLKMNGEMQKDYVFVFFLDLQFIASQFSVCQWFMMSNDTMWCMLCQNVSSSVPCEVL